MPNENEKDEFQAEGSADSTPKTPAEPSTKKRVTLRKSEARAAKGEERPRKKLFAKDEPEPAPIERAPEPVIAAPAGAEDLLAHLSWRPKQSRPVDVADEDKEKPSPKRTRERKPKAPVEKRVSAPKAEEPDKAPEKAPEPAKPKRKHIPIPERAAQVLLHNGVPSLVFQKQIQPPLVFTASFGEANNRDTVLEEARMASEKGIDTVSLFIDFVVDPGDVARTTKEAIEQMSAIVSVSPQAKFVLRTDLVPPKDWDRKYKRARYKSQGQAAPQPSVCDDEYWSVAEECLVEFTKAVRSSGHADRVLGIHLDRDGWFYPNGTTCDSSDAAQAEFRQWLRHRYRDDNVSLRAAWFDGKVTFEAVEIPEPTSVSKGDEFVRTGRKSRRWVDFNLFLSDATVDRIAKLAYAVKSASEGWWLVGVSYGYTFEWSHPGSGHLSLGKLLRCPDVDYVSSPPSYKGREPGNTSAFPAPIDSFSLNGKLSISDDDFKTPISGGTEPDSYNPVMKTPQALEGAHWRSAGAALAHRSGATWMDSWGNGWLNSRGIWDRASQVRQAFEQRYAGNQADTDVAVFIDERSLAYLVDPRAFEVLVQNVRESVLRSGLSASFYLLSDFAHRENFPEAKLYVFMNAWDIRPEVRSAIKTRLQRDNKVLFWLYCAGLFEAGRESLERVREVTGIALKPQPYHSKPGTTLVNMRHPLCAALPAQKMSEGGQLEPSYFAIPEDSTVLGEYTHTGLPSFVVREFVADNDNEHAWKSVFLGEPVVTPGLFRALGQMAGAHVWNFDDDVVHICAPYVTVHCKGAGPRTLTIPNNWCAYDLVNASWMTVESNSIRFTAIDGHTYVFLTGIKAEIEAMLGSDPETLLTLESIEPREDNTMHWDAVQFDVQIMKLDQWVEETWSEQHADDFLLKPSMLDLESEEPPAEDEEPKSRGRRRGRGRRGRGDRSRRRGSEESANARREGADRTFDEAGIGVLFRKKQ